MSGVEDADADRRKVKTPYAAKNPIPTIQHYRKERKQRLEDAGDLDDEPGKRQRAVERYEEWKHGNDGTTNGDGDQHGSQNTNASHPPKAKLEGENESDDTGSTDSDSDSSHSPRREDDGLEDTSEVTAAHHSRKARSKEQKKRGGHRAEREVTDPVTHLPITIRDFNKNDLKNIATEEDTNKAERQLKGGLVDKKMQEQAEEMEKQHEGLEALFPPPNFEAVRQEMARIHTSAVTAGLGVLVLVLVSLLVLEKLTAFGERLERFLIREESQGKLISSIVLITLGLGIGSLVMWGVRDWADNKMKDAFENEVWEAERQAGKKRAHMQVPESAQWLNTLFASIYPLINSDLWTPICDTLEDVMQASIPRIIRMISVDDLGQGTEAPRILGVRWLPHGAAGKSVDTDGKIQKQKEKQAASDRTVPGQGSVQSLDNNNTDSKEEDESKKQRTEDEQKNENIAEGMEAEEGDFVNMEIALAYRARGSSKSIKSKAQNAHLLLAIYLAGSFKLPVFVELRGLVATVRCRLQIIPDPPFISLCTLTFLGQPKVDLSCIPLTERGLNLMNFPIISKFVQSAIDAAIAEYVAPKSLTLDLKEMLVGDDFKKDTSARGVLVVRIKRAFDFKEGDPAIGFLKDGSTDGYVSVGWAKFGKPVWSTRVILSDMHPYWEETAFLLVTPQELNVDENLRVQLWDSDRTTADDDLGRTEVPVKSIMRDKRSNGKMWDRVDNFQALKTDEGMPGKLEWSVGYFSKSRVLDSQLQEQTVYKDIKSMDDLKRACDEESERKLREAKRDESKEIEMQKNLIMKDKQDQIIIATPPSDEYPSGILSVVIHQITGLELEAINKNKASKNETASEEAEEGDHLPSAYCVVVLNHQKIYKTRTKPKNSKPFYSAGTERFIRDWRTTEIHIAVFDARIHEDDSLLGMVHLPLKTMFEKRSQFCDVFPIAGGIGYGKARISMVFRSVQLQAPKELLGWDYGTVEISPEIKGNVDRDIKDCRIKARTKHSRGKFHSGEESGVWKTKRGKNLCLPVQKRYSTCLVFEFRQNAIKDKTPAYAVLWLKDIPDEEQKTVKLTVWDGDLKRAEANVLPDEESGKKVGEIEVTLTFWSGLNGYHLSFAKKDKHLRQVFKILDAANDVDEEDGVDTGTSDDSSDSDSDADVESEQASDSAEENDEDDIEARKRRFRGDAKKSSSSKNDELAESGKRGTMEQIKDYKKHAKQLHRRNRGLMQWKGPRIVTHAAQKIVEVKEKTAGLFKHHERDPGVETEV